MSYQGLFFDLDGTLIDSLMDLHASLNQALLELSLDSVSLAQTTSWIGKGTANLIHQALTAVGAPERQVSCLAAFNQAYASCGYQQTVLRPEALGCLTAWQAEGRQLALITNKPSQFTVPLLKALGIDGFFELVLSGDSLPEPKPKPMPLLHAAAHFGLSVRQCLMIGDSIHDVHAAQAAGMDVVVIRGGYGPEQAGDWQALAVIDSLEEIHHL